MSLFSMNWFKSNRDVEIKNLEKKLDLLIKPTVEPKVLYIPGVDPYKYYKKVKLVNDVLTVVLNDGSVISKSNCNSDDFLAIRNSTTEDDVLKIIISPEGHKEKEKIDENVNKIKAIRSNIDILVDSEEFEFYNDALYMKGINRSIPELLIEQFSSLFSKYEGVDVTKTDEFLSLKKFWLKCCLNPNAQSAEDLYTFLSRHQFKIDKHGNFYAYRRVVSKNDAASKELVDFISNVYIKVKAVWKQKPSNFFVHKNHETGEFTINESLYSVHNDLGNLKELYFDLPYMKENSYTDDHTGSYNYRVGEVISMPRHMGDDNNQMSCSKGFHQASREYNYSGFGDTPILSIISPIDVLAVPRGEIGKLRVCRWFFATTLPEEEQFILDDEEFDVSELGNIFEEKCMENLVEHVQNSFAEEVQRHTFNIPQLSNGELHNIVNSLEEMENVLSKRISIIK